MKALKVVPNASASWAEMALATSTRREPGVRYLPRPSARGRLVCVRADHEAALMSLGSHALLRDRILSSAIID